MNTISRRPDIPKSSVRINRIQYLALCSLWINIILVAVLLSSFLSFLPDPLDAILVWGLIIVSLVNVILLKVRRLHDFDRSGLWVFLVIVPIVGIIFEIYLFCKAGTPAVNTYGAPLIETPKIYKQMAIILSLLSIVLFGVTYLTQENNIVMTLV